MVIERQGALAQYCYTLLDVNQTVTVISTIS